MPGLTTARGTFGGMTRFALGGGAAFAGNPVKLRAE
jgi:hypothetical protein